jgi:hypothetical protein
VTSLSHGKALFLLAVLPGQALWYAPFDEANTAKNHVLGSVLCEQFGRLRATSYTLP